MNVKNGARSLDTQEKREYLVARQSQDARYMGVETWSDDQVERMFETIVQEARFAGGGGERDAWRTAQASGHDCS